MARDFVSVIKLLIKGDTSGLKKATKEASKDLKSVSKDAESTGKSFGGLGSAASAGLAGAATAAVAFGTDAVKSALGYESALARLNTALDDAGLSHGAYAKSIEKAVDANIKFGTKEDDTIALLTQGVISTKSLTKAQDLLGIAQDIHGARPAIDLARAYNGVIKASEGQLRPLKQLGIDLPVVAAGAEKVKAAHDGVVTALDKLAGIQEQVRTGRIKGKHAQDAEEGALVGLKKAQQTYANVTSTTEIVMNTLRTRFAGQADAQADTYIGKLQREQAEVDKLKTKLGELIVSTAAGEVSTVQAIKANSPTLHEFTHPSPDFSFGVDPNAGKAGHTILGAPSTSGLPTGPSTISQPGSKLPKHNSEALAPTPQQLYAAWQAQQDQVKWLKAIAANTDPKKKGDQPRAVNAHATRYAKRNGRPVSRKVFNGTPPSA